MPIVRHVLPVAALFVGLLSPGAAAQAQTAAVCSLPSLNWAYNSMDQSPCLIAAYAQAACTGGSFNVPALSNNTYYVGPKTASQATSCTCSTPVWALISACGSCQNATFITPWNDWATNCSTVYSIYPEDIPSGTAIPAWAYLPVPANGEWDPVAAKNDANAPESTATHASTVSSLSSSASVTGSIGLGNSASPSLTATDSSPHTTNTSGSSSGGGGGGSNTGAIAGGVVGGVIGLAAIAGLAFWLMRRRRNAPAPSVYSGAAPSNQGPPPSMGQAPTSATPVSGYTAPYSNMSAEQRLYNPNDPSTFPRTPTGTNYSQDPSQPPQSQFYQSAANPFQTPMPTPGVPPPGAAQPLAPNRGYHGVPEV